jgi:alpha-N-arabinofuranosidase
MIALSASAAFAGFGPARAVPRHAPMPATVQQSQTVAQPTRTLFTYRRDDQTPDQITTVQIDTTLMARAAIHPEIFGNFIEHLGGVVYEGIWAQVLLNPNLEQIEARDVAPPAWQLGGHAKWIEGGCHSPRCVALMFSPSDPGVQRGEKRQAPDLQSVSSLNQIVRLPLRRTRRYHISLFARVPEGRGQIMAGLMDRKQMKLLAGAEQWVTAAEWQPVHLTLNLPLEAVMAGPELEFKVWLQDGRSVNVDQIELFPDDSVDGVDPDVLKRTKEWHPPVLRWPGGNFASGYNWQDGIGPQDRRPTRRNAAWGGIEPNHFGTHEFLDFARRVGARPQLTVNAGDGTPENAAAWVRYCNALPTTDRYGRLRAANGAPKPFNVQIWEVGNELYGGWQIGHTDPDGNAARYVRFRDAMLQADPAIKLIATGKGEEFTPDGIRRDMEWNRALLTAATANGGKAPDYLSIHPLVPLPGITGTIPYEEQYESAMAQPAFLGQTLLPQLALLLDKLCPGATGQQSRTRIAVTEWGIIVGGNDWRQSPNHDTLSGAIFNALTLNAMLRNSDRVTLANMTALMHGGGIKKWNGVTYVDPQYYTQQLYTLARPHTPVRTITVGPGHDVPARGQLPAVANVPDVDTFAALTQDGKQLVLFAVNRHLTAARPLRLDLQGFAPRSVSATLLTAPDVRAGNGWDHPDTVHPVPFAVPPYWPAPADRTWQVTLPPHSLVVFTFNR